MTRKRARPRASLAAPPPIDPAIQAAAEAVLGHRFTRPDLLREALTHRSAVASRHGVGSNERLEFIGDRVLGLMVAEWIVERFPHEQEGALGKRLAQLVSQPVLAGIAEELGLPALLDVATPEAKAGVRRRATVLADAMEATLGAIYLDAGLDPARSFVRRAWQQTMHSQAQPPQDAKTALQEWVQARGQPLPEYVVESAHGPPHAPVFTIAVTVGPHTGRATGRAKKTAEQQAAINLMELLKP